MKLKRLLQKPVALIALAIILAIGVMITVAALQTSVAHKSKPLLPWVGSITDKSNASSCPNGQTGTAQKCTTPSSSNTKSNSSSTSKSSPGSTKTATTTQSPVQQTNSQSSAGSQTPPTNPASGGCPATKRTITSSDVSNQINSGYAAGTQLYVPDAPDPWGGCFPGPSNTGVPSGTTLTTYTGPCTISTSNTTITAKTINCDLIIQASNVQITDSKINAGNIEVNSGSFALTDSEVDFGTNINDNGLVGYNYTVLRANMHGGKRQVWCNSTCTIRDSYLHDQLTDPTGVTHESAVRVEQNTTLEHNSFLCNAPDVAPDAGCSANQTGYPDFATIHDNTIDKNYYLATTGGYCSYGGNTAGKPYSNDPQNGINIHFTNNVFQRGTNANDRTTIPLTDKRRYTCGYYGVTTDFNSSKSGFIFTGNMWDDGLLFANDSTYPYGGFYN